MQALWHAEDANLGLSRVKWLVAGGFWQEPRFGEDRHNAQCAKQPLLCLREPQNAAAEPRFGVHCYRQNAQCAKKPLLRLREPQNAAADET
ncbi:unnamed protein product [Coccothraustes coccothraustes]